MLQFRIWYTGNSGWSFGRARRNRRFGWLRIKIRVRVIAGSSGRLGSDRNNFLGPFRSLEFPLLEKGFSLSVCPSGFPLLKEMLGTSSPSKAASLPWLVIVDIGGMLFCSSPNLCTLARHGAGSSETEAFCPAKLDGVCGSGYHPQILIL